MVFGLREIALPDLGVFILVVGPSGAGKDTLIDAARAHFEHDPSFIFVRRVITRPEEACGEAHQAVSIAEFQKMSSADAFSLQWDAHGLQYGIPRHYETDRLRGRHVIANVSRHVVDQANASFTPVKTIMVTANNRVLAKRLAGRRRETEEEIERRLLRQAPVLKDTSDIIIVDNSGRLEAGVRAFISALKR
ncbi:MAG: phosphonate metabolism protein/1,5-bisphosphokinase (PRPP-forming) PhnN [Sneathiella sp.]|nr:MAG: phosphonate metabolism protein/1,5-bisphosphokinase (PRPP-forming) PhnN [Sneathiella sp.]